MLRATEILKTGKLSGVESYFIAVFRACIWHRSSQRKQIPDKEDGLVIWFKCKKDMEMLSFVST